MIRRTILLLILGIALAGAGIFMGTSSHQVTYQSVGQGTIAHYLSDSTTGYLQMSDSPTLYIVNEKDFSPAINGTSTFQDGNTISFIYEPSSTTNIDSSSTLGTHLKGAAYKVVQITRTDAGAAQQFVSSEYKQNPNGFYQNNWPIGIAMLLGGLALLGLGFFLLTRRKKQTAGFGVTPSPAMNAMAGQPGANPYQQPYQGPGQYSQPQGAYPPVQPGSGQYPPAPAQYGQPPQGAYPPAQQNPYPGAYPPPPAQYDPNRPYNPPPTP